MRAQWAGIDLHNWVLWRAQFIDLDALLSFKNQLTVVIEGSFIKCSLPVLIHDDHAACSGAIVASLTNITRCNVLDKASSRAVVEDFLPVWNRREIQRREFFSASLPPDVSETLSTSRTLLPRDGFSATRYWAGNCSKQTHPSFLNDGKTIRYLK